MTTSVVAIEQTTGKARFVFVVCGSSKHAVSYIRTQRPKSSNDALQPQCQSQLLFRVSLLVSDNMNFVKEGVSLQVRTGTIFA